MRGSSESKISGLVHQKLSFFISPKHRYFYLLWTICLGFVELFSFQEVKLGPEKRIYELLTDLSQSGK